LRSPEAIAVSARFALGAVAPGGPFLRRWQPRTHDPTRGSRTRMHGDAKEGVIYRNSTSVDVVGSAVSRMRWTYFVQREVDLHTS
jgi:hypothetical protein